MWIYILKRLLQLLFLLLAVGTCLFFLMHIVPGDPTTAILGETTHQIYNSGIPPSQNPGHPLPTSYLQFLKDILHLNLGKSLIDGRSVAQSIYSILPYTLSLSIVAMCLALLVSFPLAIWAAFGENTLMDTGITLLSTLGSAIPSFFLGPLLIVFFSVKLGWLPISGANGFKSLLLPALTLAFSMSTLLTRMIKTALATELKKPYVLLAYAKGFSQPRLFYKHLLKNAMIPIFTTVGLQLGALLTGTVITETVFSRPGIGSLLISAIQQRDYPMIQGIVFFITLVYLLLSFCVDLSYFFFDPRLRHELNRRHRHV